MNDFPTIETERLKLRGPYSKDLHAVFEIHSNPEVMQYYGVLPYDSIEKAQKHLDWLAFLQRENKGFRPIITLKGEDSYIGDVGYYDFEEKHHRAEIGYILGENYWGKGIMTEALDAMLRYGFTMMGLNRVQALVDSTNKGSERVLKKLGFKYEGTLRDYELEYGEYINLDMYSLLKREYS